MFKCIQISSCVSSFENAQETKFALLEVKYFENEKCREKLSSPCFIIYNLSRSSLYKLIMSWQGLKYTIKIILIISTLRERA